MNWTGSPEERYEGQCQREIEGQEQDRKKAEFLTRTGECLIQRWHQLRDAQRAFDLAENHFRGAMKGNPAGWWNESTAPTRPYLLAEHLIDFDGDKLVIRKCSVLVAPDVTINDVGE